MRRIRTLSRYEVTIDNASQVNVVYPRFLENIKEGLTSYKGVDNKQQPIQGGLVGDLPGFFECVANKDARISILSQDDVEQIYKLT